MSAEKFRLHLAQFGIDYNGAIHTDGKLHRFKAEGDKDRNSWYVLHDGATMAGAFGCWKRGIRETWHDKSRHLSGAELQEVSRKIREATELRDHSEAQRKEQACKTAAYILQRSEQVNPEHPYLTRKGVRHHGGLRLYKGKLVLPMRDVTGALCSLQFIDRDGGKKFLSGGQKSGCFFALSDDPEQSLVICEGYATGASIREATGLSVVVAFDCGNLMAVAKALRVKYPDRPIIIAADNDAHREDNPGLAKATEAAAAIQARLAVPQFKQPSTLTDFNDMQDPTQIKAIIDSAVLLSETDEQAFARLAKLSPADYDRSEKAEAAKLNIKVATLRAEVKKRRPKEAAEGGQGGVVCFPDVEPWPEPVDGPTLFDAIAERYQRYLVLPDGAAEVLALWPAHTHCLDAFVHSPRLNITAVDKGCGKSTCRDVIALFVKKPLALDNISAAPMFRLIEEHQPTILADEYDAWLQDENEKRGILNSGHKRGGFVARCQGDNNEVRVYRTFAPVVLCGIGALPGTLHDRSIIIRLERAKDGEVPERFSEFKAEREAELARKLARWAADNLEAIKEADPAMPPGAFNRVGDNWRALFAIADVAGGGWGERAREAFRKLTATADSDALGTQTMLLVDIHHVFTGTGCDRMSSAGLCARLAEIDGRPWAEHGKSQKPITANALAKLLRRQKISPRTMRIGEDVLKGYELSDFSDVFDRYLPKQGLQSVTTLQGPSNKGGTAVSEALHPTPCNDSESGVPTNRINGCNGVTDDAGVLAGIMDDDVDFHRVCR